MPQYFNQDMIFSLKNSLMSWVMRKRIHQIDLFRNYPHEVQQEWLESLLDTAKNTEWGKLDYLNKDFQDEVFQNGLSVLEQCNHKASLTPHANYSVSLRLFEKIRSHNSGEIITIHNQETSTEDEMFIKGSGKLLNELIARHFFKFTGKTALKSTLPLLPNAPVLMVHNTFTTIEDVQWAIKHYDNVFWATCPKANLYIEDALPNYDFFIDTS